jgi:hypothetical protein
MVPHQIISIILLEIPRVELLEELFNNPLPKEFDQTKPTRYNVSSEVEFEV